MKVDRWKKVGYLLSRGKHGQRILFTGKPTIISKKRKADGCISVEMECSAIQAMCDFRNQRRFDEEIVMILETERLYLREMEQSDLESLCKILQDAETMYAYEGAFSDAEVQEWLDRQISRYHQYGFGLWAVVLKETDEMIGQCGLTMQPWKDQELLEVGYLLQRLYWHNGYATEAAKACKKYAFEVLNEDEVCSIVRDTNVASQNVAIRNGMMMADTWTKHYRDVDMAHYRYVVRRA